jgi:hypothetical protein
MPLDYRTEKKEHSIFTIKKKIRAGHGGTCNPNMWGGEEDHKFKTSLDYIGSTRPAWTTS